MRKIILFLILLLSLCGVQTVAADATGEVYTELYRMDFDAVDTVAAETDKTAFEAVYGDAAKFFSNKANFNYTVAPKTEGSTDKYLQMDSDYSDNSSGTSALQIWLPDGGIKANNGTYKISYDIRWNDSEQKPFLRLKTNHYATEEALEADTAIAGNGGIYNWGPMLSGIAPITGSGSKDQSANGVYGTYSTYPDAENASWFTESWNNRDKVRLSPGKWHRAEVKIDTVNLKAYYYFNGKYAGCQEGSAFVSRLICGTNTAKNIQFQVEQGYNVQNGYQLDNIVISHFDGEAVDPGELALYEELYRMDFDELDDKQHFTAEQTPNTEAFDEVYGTSAKLLSTSGTYSYSIGSKREDIDDKFIELKQTDVTIDFEGDTSFGGTSAIQIKLPEDGFKANTGIYKISYDARWFNASNGSKPFLRVKTTHIDPSTDATMVNNGGIFNWGPCLNAIAPLNEAQEASRDAADIYGTYSIWDYIGDGGTNNGAENKTSFTANFDKDGLVRLRPGVWNSVEIIIDTDNKRADYYYNGVYSGNQEGDTFGERYISGSSVAKYIQLQAEQGYETESGWQLDNIVISKAKDKIRDDVEISTFDIIDTNGGYIESGDELTAEVVIRNATEKEQTALLLMAIYEDGILAKVDSEQVSAPSGALCSRVRLTVDNPEQAEVRAFLWRSGESGSPMHAPIIFTEKDLGVVDTTIDFEDKAFGNGFDKIFGEGGIIEADNGSGGMFLFDNADRTGRTTATVALDKTVDRGVLKVEFDYKVTTFVNLMYIRAISTDGQAANTFCDRNTFAYYADTTGWTLGDKRAAYDTDEWNTVSMYINFDTKMVYFFKNGDMYGFTTLNENFSDAALLQFVCEGSYGDTYIDNLNIKEYAADDEGLPDEVRQTTTVQINTSAVGRIFYDRALQTFTVTAANKTKSPVEYVLKYSAVKGGEPVYEQEKTIQLQAGEVKDIEIQTQTDGFGYYYADAKLYDTQGNLLADADDVRFSVSNIPAEGVKNRNAGIQMNSISNMNANDMIQDLKLVEPLGFYYSRASVGSWEVLVPESGKFTVPSWQQYIADQFTEHGLMQTPTAAYSNPAITTENPPRSPEALAEFAWFAKQLAMYYHSNNFNMPREYMDIWNEYWMEGNVFNPDRNTPEDYARMLIAVYTAVKDEQASPNTRIFGFSGLDLPSLEWAERILAAGAANYMDGYSIHPYSNKDTPEGVDLPGFVADIDELFAKYGRYDMPVWISEWGWPSSGHSGYPNEMEQASYFVRAFVINSSYDCAEMINWYASNDLQNDTGQESRFGLFRNQYAEIPYEAKPVYLTAANYNTLMTGAEPVSIHTLGGNVTGYRYKLSDGRDCIVAWAVENTEEVSFTLDTNSVTIYDAYGNQSGLSGENSNFSIVFDIMPQYIVGNFSKIN